ncbi:aspartyl protease family protein [Armatimonas rosea]|uniref:Retroviral-like aspartic protease n=1 Tax=Armatimonas rosea TaxID=685828 RepID=A0A7W9SR52_ARMRO|nr:aspartyl protease family protein [Armatimonas rosea]MBB6050708.1 hypothetical protein [Armatimonas rosea]
MTELEPATFPFVNANPHLPGSSLVPLLPFFLSYQSQQLATAGMLDTGASINVLPYSLGLELGLSWEDQHHTITLAGNLAQIPARGVVLSATVASFPPVRLAFAWAQTDHVRVLLGQVNFFQEFNVCFFRSQSMFEVMPATR